MSAEIASKVASYFASKNPRKIKGLYLISQIPQNTLMAAREKFAPQLTAAEKPLIYFEKKTIVGVLKTAFIMTDQCFHYYGWNDPSKFGGDPRSGAFPLRDIRSLVFKKGSFELNGFTYDTSAAIPIFFEIGKELEALLNGLFFELIPTIHATAGIQTTAASGVPLAGAQYPSPMATMAPSTNPLTAGPRNKPGCLKIGCAIIVLLGAIALLVIGLGM